MSDRELLELAAKAAGILGQYFHGVEPIHAGIYRAEHGYYWNPLESDSEAFRLAVKLELRVMPPCLSDADPWAVVDSYGKHKHRHSSEDGCIYAATRRAIVLAAADIGMAMP